MKKINWKVRLKSKTFWIAFIPSLLLTVQAVLAVFGVTIDIAFLSEQLIHVVNTVFILLAILGIATDPTTKGIGDSEQAMSYTCPRCDQEDAETQMQLAQVYEDDRSDNDEEIEKE